MKILIAIVTGALIGWITNYLAIKMLFRPYKEINLGIFKIQGLIPKRKNDIGNGIADVIEQELLSVKDILVHLNDDELFIKLEETVDRIMDKNLKIKIKENFPFLAVFLNESTINDIKKTIKDIIFENRNEVILFFSDYIQNKVDFKSIVTDKISNFSLEKLEKIILELAKKELKHIEIIGGVLGAIIGFFQYLIFVLF